MIQSAQLFGHYHYGMLCMFRNELAKLSCIAGMDAGKPAAAYIEEVSRGFVHPRCSWGMASLQSVSQGHQRQRNQACARGKELIRPDTLFHSRSNQIGFLYSSFSILQRNVSTSLRVPSCPWSRPCRTLEGMTSNRWRTGRGNPHWGVEAAGPSAGAAGRRYADRDHVRAAERGDVR